MNIQTLMIALASASLLVPLGIGTGTPIDPNDAWLQKAEVPLGGEPRESPPSGLGTLDPWIDATGDLMFGDLDVGSHSVILEGTPLYAAEGMLWFGEQGVCFVAGSCPGTPGPQGEPGPTGPQGEPGPAGDPGVIQTIDCSPSGFIRQVDGDGIGSCASPLQAWLLGGNAGTTGGTHFVGTTDAQPLELHVNGMRVLRLEADSAPNLLGGSLVNQVTPGVQGATIAGGGTDDDGFGAAWPNRVTDDFGAIGGGYGNQAGDDAGSTSDRGWATVGGGNSNTASSTEATVGGGFSNTASGSVATVGGGAFNTASSTGATVGGGNSNTASGIAATVGGGVSNAASGLLATVGGGVSNAASGSFATVGGGNANTASSNRATVGGGSTNAASSTEATVGGGVSNAASGLRATVGGGSSNAASGVFATVGGGTSNTASGLRATVPGGQLNTAAGDYSFAAGQRARALHDGAFVWADFSSSSFLDSTVDHEFRARASGGVTFFTDSAATVGANLPAGSGTWGVVSDANLKRGVAPVDSEQVLDSVLAMPVSTWSYVTQDASIRHMGPMAQDFHAAFGLGEDDRHISTVDADGVALAAIQGLHDIVEAQAQELEQEREKNRDLEHRLHRLETLILNLER